MAQITKIKIGDGEVYDIHDADVDGCLTRLTTLENNVITYKTISGNTYTGLARRVDKPDNHSDDGGWIRTTKAGILPYEPNGGSVSATYKSNLGASNWLFKNVYSENFIGKLQINTNNNSGINGVVPLDNGGTGVKNYAGIDNPLVPEKGWKIGASKNRGLKWGHFCYVCVYLERTGAKLTGPAAGGNIADITLGTIKAGYRPSCTSSWTSNASPAGCFGYVNKNGLTKITNMSPNSVINVNAVLHFTAMYFA